MKKILKIMLGLLFAALMVGTFVFLWQKTRPKVIIYAAVAPKIDTIEQFVVATGKVEPRDEVLIKPQISGIISSVVCDAGDMIKKGDVIANVKVIPEMGALNNAESRVSMAHININQVESENKRSKELFASGVISQEESDKSNTSLKQAVEELQSAKDNLEIVQNGIAKRYAAMSNTQIRSTIDGMILDVPIKVGNSVIQSNTFNDGTTIAIIADMSNMIFKGNIDEVDVGKLHDDMPVELTIGAMQSVALDAVLEYISPKSIDDNGIIKFEVEAAVVIPDTIFLRSGYSANASILIKSSIGVLSIPESTIAFKDGKTMIQVFTSAINEDENEEQPEQTFEEREVEIGLSDGVNIEITSGLTAEDRVRGEKKSEEKKG